MHTISHLLFHPGSVEIFLFSPKKIRVFSKKTPCHRLYLAMATLGKGAQGKAADAGALDDGPDTGPEGEEAASG